MSIDVYFQNNERELEKLDADVVTALTDPLYQGFFHLRHPSQPKIKAGDKIDIYKDYWFASNFGLVPNSAGMTVLHYMTKDYKITHFTDEPLMFETKDKISRATFKLSDGGRYYLIHAASDQVMSALKKESYTPKIIPNSMKSYRDFRRQKSKEILSNITPEFVERVNQQYYNGCFDGRMDELEKKLISLLGKPDLT